MSPALLQRQAALAGVALLAALGVLALDRSGDDGSPATPAPVAPTAGWEEAVAGIFGPGRYGETTACGVELEPGTRGVAHPVLPCGVDLIVSYGGLEKRAEVIDRGPAESGRQFDLTKALADDLGLHGTDTVRWRFAG